MAFSLDDVKAKLPEILAMLGSGEKKEPPASPHAPCSPCADKAAKADEPLRMDAGITLIEIVDEDGSSVQTLRIHHFEAARAFEGFRNEIAAHNEAEADASKHLKIYALLDKVIAWVEERCGARLSLEQADWLYDSVFEIQAKKKLTRAARFEAMQTSLRRQG
jgi:hypothetical protein